MSKDIKEGLDSISWGLFWLGLFLGLGTCGQKVTPAAQTDFQYCSEKYKEEKTQCFENLKQLKIEVKP